MKSETTANFELQPIPKQTSWLTPSTCKQHYRPKKNYSFSEYAGAIVIGLIIAAPFIFNIIKDF